MHRFHYTPTQFYLLSPVEFHYAIKDDRMRQEQNTRDTFDAMRLQTWVLVNMQVKKGHQLSQPEKLFTFPWDKKKEQKTQSLDEMKAALMAIAGKPVRKK